MPQIRITPAARQRITAVRQLACTRREVLTGKWAERMGTLMATPISELTKDFTAEDWAYVEAGQAEIREAIAKDRMAVEIGGRFAASSQGAAAGLAT